PAPRKRQPLGAVRLTGVSLCEGEDSNLHGSYPASTSSWCVCHSATFAGWTTSETRGVAGAGKLGGSGVMSRPEKLSRFRLLSQQPRQGLEQLAHLEGFAHPGGEATRRLVRHAARMTTHEHEGSLRGVPPERVEPVAQPSCQ